MLDYVKLLLYPFLLYMSTKPHQVHDKYNAKSIGGIKQNER